MGPSIKTQLTEALAKIQELENYIEATSFQPVAKYEDKQLMERIDFLIAENEQLKAKLFKAYKAIEALL